jgi:hypothetical protein
MNCDCKPPKLWVIQWTDVKENPQIQAFRTKAEALTFLYDPLLCATIYHESGVFMYRLGTTAPLRKHYGVHAQ